MIDRYTLSTHQEVLEKHFNLKWVAQLYKMQKVKISTQGVLSGND